MNIPAAKIYFPEEDREEILEKIGKVLETGQLTLGIFTDVTDNLCIDPESF